MTDTMSMPDITYPIPSNDPYLEIPQEFMVSDAKFGDWKCGCCKRIQGFACKQVWIPGGVQHAELKHNVKINIEACTYFEAWCFTCVKNLFPVNDNMPDSDYFYLKIVAAVTIYSIVALSLYLI